MMAVSGHSGATAMVWRRGAPLCSGVGERARCESKMGRATEVHAFTPCTGPIGQASAGVRQPRSAPGLLLVGH